MFIRNLIMLLLLCTSSQSQDEPICTLSGEVADSIIQTLPRDATAYAQVGILFTNKVFLRNTNDGKRDADSAIVFLTSACESKPTPRLQVYLYIAKALRASKDGFWAKVTGGTKSRATEAFDACDSIARSYPDDLGVQFLTANLLEEGDRLEKNWYYWQRAWDILTALHVRDAGSTGFFTEEVRGMILLNQGKLIIKLRLYGETSSDSANMFWARVIAQYPNTSAAENARDQLKKH
jgi:hypothetical protein